MNAANSLCSINPMYRATIKHIDTIDTNHLIELTRHPLVSLLVHLTMPGNLCAPGLDYIRPARAGMDVL